MVGYDGSREADFDKQEGGRRASHFDRSPVPHFDNIDRGRREGSVLTRHNLTEFDRGPEKRLVLTYQHHMLVAV